MVNTTGAGFTLAYASLASDWIVGSNATTATLPTAFTSGLTTPGKYNANVSVDVFATPVPLPSAVWAMLGGMLLLVPALTRQRAFMYLGG